MMPIKRNLLCELTYDGSLFHGWQVQKNALSVQQVLGEAVYALTGERAALKGCSRTDAGVHARSYFASFAVHTSIPVQRIGAALNAHLAKYGGIAVKTVREVAADFHARYDCTGKTYRYFLFCESYRDPFWGKYAWRWPYSADADKLNRLAQDFVGRHDFASFMAAGSNITDTVREIYAFRVRKEGALVIFEVSGNGFLYHMVRIMVGTLLDLASGKLTMPIPDILAQKDRKAAGVTAPAHGLFLWQVCYHQERERTANGREQNESTRQ